MIIIALTGLQDGVRMEGYHERKAKYYLYNWLLIWLYNLSQLVWQMCFSQKTIILCCCQNVATSWTVYNGDTQHLLCVFLNGGCHSFTRGWIGSHLLRIFRRALSFRAGGYFLLLDLWVPTVKVLKLLSFLDKATLLKKLSMFAFSCRASIFDGMLMQNKYINILNTLHQGIPHAFWALHVWVNWVYSWGC